MNLRKLGLIIGSIGIIGTSTFFAFTHKQLFRNSLDDKYQFSNYQTQYDINGRKYDFGKGVYKSQTGEEKLGEIVVSYRCNAGFNQKGGKFLRSYREKQFSDYFLNELGLP